MYVYETMLYRDEIILSLGDYLADRNPGGIYTCRSNWQDGICETVWSVFMDIQAYILIGSGMRRQR